MPQSGQSLKFLEQLKASRWGWGATITFHVPTRPHTRRRSIQSEATDSAPRMSAPIKKIFVIRSVTRVTRDVFTIGATQRIDLELQPGSDNFYASGPGVSKLCI